MREISTPFKQNMSSDTVNAAGCRAAGPSKKTIAILRQFARAYMPINANSAIILN